jgi:cysteine desulfurase family protein
LIYLDNAATTFPKPPGVLEAMARYQQEIGANPGRSGHRLSIEAARIVYETREKAALLFRALDPSRVVFGMNATEALNLALRGLLRSGDHVITTSMEHNSVMRPLRAMEREGVSLSIIPCSEEGFLDPTRVGRELHANTRMLVVNHGSNVTGTLQPIEEIGGICREKGILFLVDAAQTAGAVPIRMEEQKIDLLAFTGHKALFGPQGTGGLVIGRVVDEKVIVPLKRGGTGSRSEMEEQPEFFPDLCESGTPNTVGLAGLGAGLDFVLQEGVDKIRSREKDLTRMLIAGLRGIPGVTVYGPKDPQRQIGTVSFNIVGMEPSEAGLLLDEQNDVLCRVGLHCSPSAHKTIGTFSVGTVRFGISYLNTEEDIEGALKAVSRLAKRVS